jgi:hypothetical protein
VAEWTEHAEREEARYREGEERLPEALDDDARQRQLTRMGNAAAGAGLAHLMLGDSALAREWFDRAVGRYRESYPLAPPGSWGRPIAILKTHILSGNWDGAESDARWTLDQGAAEAETPIGRYAACLALVVLGRDEEARALADGLRTHEGFPSAVGDALAYVAAEDPLGYVEAIEAVLESFETREEYLEDLPVADTVIVLQALAARRGMAASLSSPLLPGLR